MRSASLMLRSALAGVLGMTVALSFGGPALARTRAFIDPPPVAALTSSDAPGPHAHSPLVSRVVPVILGGVVIAWVALARRNARAESKRGERA